MSLHFDHCLILIPDSVYDISLQVSQGLSREEAHCSVLAMTESFLAEHNHLFVSNDCEFTIFKSSSLAETKEYVDYYAALHELFVNDRKFNSSIQAFIDTYFLRQSQLSQTPNEHDMSCQFILAELAISACISDMGYRIAVYPGSIGLFDEISAGIHQQIPQALQRLINVGIGFRKKGGKGLALPSLSESVAEI